MNALVEVFPASRAERAAWRSVCAAMQAMQAAGVSIAKFRLIGGAMVTLHVRRLGLEHVTIRATRDADIGVPLTVLAGWPVEEQLTELFEHRPSGNRWTTDEGLAVDVLVHDPRASTRTPEINGRQFDRAAGLHLALRRPPVLIDVSIEGVRTEVPLPDPIAALALKLAVFGKRHETKDLEDVWRLLEVVRADRLSVAEVQEVLGPEGTPFSYLAELRRIAGSRRLSEGLDDKIAVALRALAAAYTSTT